MKRESEKMKGPFAQSLWLRKKKYILKVIQTRKRKKEVWKKMAAL